jgi:hypothetical protein
METAKNAGQLFRLFNLVEFGTNQGISTQYKKQGTTLIYYQLYIRFGLECGICLDCEWHIPSSKSQVLQYSDFDGKNQIFDRRPRDNMTLPFFFITYEVSGNGQIMFT